MSFIDSTELVVYAPDAAYSSGALAVLTAQAAIDAYLGYSLEQAARVEILKLTRKSRTAQLSFWPIASTPTPTFEVREGNLNDRFSREIPLTDWYTLNAGDYVLDDTGLITVNTVDTSLVFGRGVGQSNYLRATYTAGLDFTTDTAEINALKAMAGQIVTYGISEYQAVDDLRIKYGQSGGGSGAQAGQVPEVFFRPLNKYKPRAGALFG
jgi:hypothetical protein